MRTEHLVVLVLILMILTGCQPRTVRVEVPVSVPCLGPAPAAPAYQFGGGEYPGEKGASKALLSDLNAAKGYAVDLKTQMAGCR